MAVTQPMHRIHTEIMSALLPHQKEALERTASSLACRGKGITACDESAGTIGERFEAVGITNTEENRRRYRQMLFSAPTCEEYLCGAILDPLTQKSDGGRPFPLFLRDRGITTGVKVHLKACVLPGTGGDTVMQGLDSLASRCGEYRERGARFAKWRSPLAIDVSSGRPTDLAIRANMSDLARYALICQSGGLMPIVEPDVSLSGSHTLEEAISINTRVLSELFRQMIEHRVHLLGATLKSNIVNPGRECPVPYTVDDIARANVSVLERTFPVAMKTANYLSGGQSLGDAAARLSAINRLNRAGPWNLSFSWSAALQLPLLELCRGKGGLQLDVMQKLYIEELETASEAAKVEWDGKEGDGDHKGYRKREFPS